VAVYLVEKFPLGPPALVIILGGAPVFRLLVLPLEPPLSEDVYRYQWEGRIQRAHFNPYRVFPQSPDLRWLRDPKHPLETGRTTPSVYPPLSEMAFLWLKTVPAYKRLFTTLDLASVAMLLILLAISEKPPHRVLTYAWNPTVIVSFAMCGHHDSLAIVTLLTASLLIITRRRALSMVFLALSFLAKLFPLLLLPVFLQQLLGDKRTHSAVPGSQGDTYGFGRSAGQTALRGESATSGESLDRPDRRAQTPIWAYAGLFAAVVILGYLPYVGAGLSLFRGLADYASAWEANDSVFRLVRLVSTSKAQAELVVGVMALGLVVYAVKNRMELPRASLFLTAGLLLLSPNAFPWYFTWSIPFLCFCPSTPWLLMSVTAVLGYAPVIAYAAGQPYMDRPFVLAVEYVPVYLWLGYEGWRQIRN
jgi:hypothetical protein